MINCDFVRPRSFCVFFLFSVLFFLSLSLSLSRSLALWLLIYFMLKAAGCEWAIHSGITFECVFMPSNKAPATTISAPIGSLAIAPLDQCDKQVLKAKELPGNAGLVSFP